MVSAYVVVENGQIVRQFDNEAGAMAYKARTGSGYVVVDLNKPISEQLAQIQKNDTTNSQVTTEIKADADLTRRHVDKKKNTTVAKRKK
jgi:hypothetical protein